MSSYNQTYEQAMAAMAPFATTRDRIPLKRSYPGFIGERNQPSSKLNGMGLSQQFIDRGLQKELNIRRTTLNKGADGKYRYAWTMTFYTNPGMRKEIMVEPKVLPDLADYVHALAVGVAPKDELSRRLDDWVKFHTFGMGGQFGTGKDALKFLKRVHFPFSTVEKNIPDYGIKTFQPSADSY